METTYAFSVASESSSLRSPSQNTSSSSFLVPPELHEQESDGGNDYEAKRGRKQSQRRVPCDLREREERLHRKR